MPAYQVLIDDHFNYMDESARELHGTYSTEEEATTKCRVIVESSVHSLSKPGMSKAELLDLYMSFGEDPWIKPVGGANLRNAFSASEYARQLIAAMTISARAEDGASRS
jgi:hypothetical protein